MSRITREEMCMQIALIVAERSTCERKSVGAVIVRDGRVLSTGYAGAPSGLRHCSPDLCDIMAPCDRTVHAEANAIAFAAREGISTNMAEIFVTCSPCVNCAKLIINSGIAKVTYLEEYRDIGPIALLTAANVQVKKYDWPTDKS